ncbi:unnamed protein product, partial [Polarella glacialis]
ADGAEDTDGVADGGAGGESEEEQQPEQQKQGEPEAAADDGMEDGLTADESVENGVEVSGSVNPWMLLAASGFFASVCAGIAFGALCHAGLLKSRSTREPLLGEPAATRLTHGIEQEMERVPAMMAPSDGASGRW